MLQSTAVFSYNSKAKYRAGGVYPNTGIRASTLTHPTIMVDSKSTQFTIKYPNIFEKYKVTATNIEQVHNWFNNPMQFWQNQLHFAIWCATSGCGVSTTNHLATTGFTKSLFLFHVYYQTRRILAVIQAPLPQDKAWDASHNPYNRRAYEIICNEFGISPQTDWRRHGINQGLGTPYGGVHTIKEVSDMTKATSLPWAILHSNEWGDKLMNFKGGKPYTVSRVEQPDDPAWTNFMLDKSEGFTRPGIERINDSIRTYVWAIVGAQAQTRTDIVGVGTAFDAQKQFLANVEDAISSPVDLPSTIKRYQDVLRYAGSKVDFVFGIGLYMAPSNMRLKVGQIAGYNNEIVIATDKQTLGVNSDVNLSVVPQPKEVGIVKPQSPSIIKPSNIKPHLHPDVVSQNNQHIDEKTALVVGGVAVGLLMIWFST